MYEPPSSTSNPRLFRPQSNQIVNLAYEFVYFFISVLGFASEDE